MIHGRYRGVPFNSTFFQGLCEAKGEKKKIRNELSQAFFPAIKCFKSPRRGTGEIHPSC